MPSETAMLLTQQEWDDLATICIRWMEMVGDDRNEPWYERHERLCRRIIDAAEV